MIGTTQVHGPRPLHLHDESCLHRESVIYGTCEAGMKSERSGPGIPRLDRVVSKEAMLASSEPERTLAEFVLALTLRGDAAFVNP